MAGILTFSFVLKNCQQVIVHDLLLLFSSFAVSISYHSLIQESFSMRHFIILIICFNFFMVEIGTSYRSKSVLSSKLSKLNFILYMNFS